MPQTRDEFIIKLAGDIYSRMHGKLPITDKNAAHNNSQMEQAIDYAEMFYQKLKARNYQFPDFVTNFVYETEDTVKEAPNE